jgi:hypothetical protein
LIEIGFMEQQRALQKKAGKAAQLVPPRRLAGLAPNTAIDWSDSWSDSDLQEFNTASARSVEAAEPEDSD